MSEVSFNWPRAVLVCVTAALFCSYQVLIQGAPALMVSPLADSLELTMTQVGLLSSSFLYAYLIFQVPGAYLAGRCNLRVLLVICYLVMAAGCYWFSVAETMLSASMARVLMGIATSPSIVVSMTLVSRWFPEKWFPTLAGLVETAALAGGALGPVIIPDIMALGGWRYAMQWLAVAGVGLSLLALLFVRDAPAVEHSGRGVSEERQYGQSSFPQLMKQGTFWLCCLYGFGMFAVLACFASLWGVPFLCERFPDDHSYVPHTIFLLFAGAAVGAPLIGFRASVSGRYRQLMALSALACMVFTGLAIFLPCSLVTMGCLCFFIGFSSGGYMLVFAAVKKVCSKENQGLGIAVANGSLLLGGPAMQPLVGAILNNSLQHSGVLTVTDYQWALVPMFAVQLVAFAITFLLTGIRGC
ncbi:MFS transporter [Endozoicomonas sp. Mp262]|uniref:MFS transporter n=1 Tax=Endozoicomonas sp. Mp262 TaxID=2919499 RepID=UPI0021D9F59A